MQKCQLSVGTFMAHGLASRGSWPLSTDCVIWSISTRLAQALILQPKADENLSLSRPAGHSCTMAEARGNYPESKEVGLRSTFLTLTLGFPMLHLIPTPRRAEPLRCCVCNTWHRVSIQNCPWVNREHVIPV